MASARGESSENNQGIRPNEDKRTEYQDTEAIVMHFMVQPHQGETQRAEEHGEMESPLASARSDALEELRAGNDIAPISQDVQEVVDNLTKMAEELNTKYRKKIRDMTDALSLTPGTAYESFAAVARGLFRTGIDWGKVVALLCFGHEIAMRVMQGHFGGGFLLRIIQFVVDFIFREQIAPWIAENGGWVRLMAKFQHSPILHHSSKYRALSFSVSPISCTCIIKYGALLFSVSPIRRACIIKYGALLFNVSSIRHACIIKYGALLFNVSPIRHACIIKYGAVRKCFHLSYCVFR